MKNKIPVPPEKLKEHYDDQISFLMSSCESFDRGFDGEAKRLAIALRILLHDTRYSKSLLSQLNLKNRDFLSTCLPFDKESIVSHSGLYMMALSPEGAKYIPMLDEGLKKWLPFNEWWEEEIFIEDFKNENESRNTLSRKQLITTVADQDGGAHVDPSIDELYYKFMNDKNFFTINHDGSITYIPQKPERVSVRQVAHEVLKTLIPSYSKVPDKTDVQMFVGGFGWKVGPISPSVVERKLGRNELCWCNSGKKYKYCHGK